MISHTPEHQAASFLAVKETVKSGRIKISRIEESVARIAGWKKLIQINQKNYPNPSGWSPERLAEKVITFIDGQKT